MIRVLEIIRNFDVFGRPINLNFDKKWNTYDTNIGGVFTGLMVIFTFIYTCSLFDIMVNHS